MERGCVCFQVSGVLTLAAVRIYGAPVQTSLILYLGECYYNEYFIISNRNLHNQRIPYFFKIPDFLSILFIFNFVEK